MSTFLSVRQFASKRGFPSTFPRSGKYASCFIDVPLADSSTLLETHGPAEEAGKAMKKRLMEMGLAQKGPGAPKGNHNATGGVPPKKLSTYRAGSPAKPFPTTAKKGGVELAKKLKGTLDANPNLFPAGEAIVRQADAEFDAEEKKKREAKKLQRIAEKKAAKKKAVKTSAKKALTKRPRKKLINALKKHADITKKKPPFKTSPAKTPSGKPVVQAVKK